jgi:hypothetical protein
MVILCISLRAEPCRSPPNRQAPVVGATDRVFSLGYDFVVLDRLRRANDFINRRWLIGLPLAIGVCFGLGVAVGEAVGASLKTALFIGAGTGIGMLLGARSERPHR